MSDVIESFCESDTFELGKKAGRMCAAGDIFLLDGDLGAGKTVFAKGFGLGLGIDETIVSPTFTIMQIYEGGRLTLYHFDAYRIGGVEEMEEIGYEDYFFGKGVCLVEWASLIKEAVPAGCVRVGIEKDLKKGPDYRRIFVDRPS